MISEKDEEPKPKKNQHISFQDDKKNDSGTEIGSSVRSTAKADAKAGPARRRQPSFKEEAPPLYDLFALSVSRIYSMYLNVD